MSLPRKVNNMLNILKRFESLHVLDVTNARKQSNILTFFLILTLIEKKKKKKKKILAKNKNK